MSAGVAPAPPSIQLFQPLAAPRWQAPQFSEPTFVALLAPPRGWLCALETGPGFMKRNRRGPLSARSNVETVNAASHQVKTARRLRQLRIGPHGASEWLQAPEGSGPSRHGPPNSAGRVQR